MEPQGLDDLEPPDQHSVESRLALEQATRDLISALQRHVDYATGMRGGSSELKRLHKLNDEVEKLVAAWDDRVLDHTGTSPVVLLTRDPVEEDADDEDPENEDLPAGVEDVTVVSRWDLRITDRDALLRAGREAHKQSDPTENDEDARAVVRSSVDALYALRYERGEPWYEFPGVHVVSGARMYLRPEEPLRPVDPSPDQLDAYLRRPAGEEVLSEGWAETIAFDDSDETQDDERPLTS